MKTYESHDERTSKSLNIESTSSLIPMFEPSSVSQREMPLTINTVPTTVSKSQRLTPRPG